MSDTALADGLKARDRERWLACLWAPKAARPALIAIHAYDLEQARITAEAKEPMLGEIKLAWWRERLVALAEGKPAPPEPILAALAAHAVPRGVDLRALSALEEGVLPLLLEGPLDVLAMAAARGGALFVALAQALAGGELGQAEHAAATLAGTRFALAQNWRGAWGSAAEALTAQPPPTPPPTPPAAPAPGPLPGHLRGLLALAQDDLMRVSQGKPLARAASPGRQWRLGRAAI